MCYVLLSGAVSSIESMEGAVRTLGSKLVFPDTRTTILACCIIYFFRYSNINKIRGISSQYSLMKLNLSDISLSLLLINEYSLKGWVLGTLLALG